MPRETLSLQRRASAQTRRSGLARPSRSGFTLLEIMMVLALLGLLAGLFITAARTFTDDGPRTPEEIFWATVNAARKQALLSGRDVRVAYAPPAKDEPAALVLTTPGKIGASATEEVDASEQEARFPFAADDDVKLDFLSTQKSRTAILVGGQLIETQILPTVTFYADGTCTPFRVQIRTERGVAQTLAIDPWTCAPVLAATEPAR